MKAYVVTMSKDDHGQRRRVLTIATNSFDAAKKVTSACGAPPHAFDEVSKLHHSRARRLINRIMRNDMDLIVGTPGTPHHIAQDSHRWIGLAFTMAAAADHYHGRMVKGYQPPRFAGSKGMLAEEENAEVKRVLRNAAPQTVEDAEAIVYRYAKMLEANHQ